LGKQLKLYFINFWVRLVFIELDDRMGF
jgi:hypothetical protein